LFVCTFSFGHCVICSSSIYGFWLPLWYLQTLLVTFSKYVWIFISLLFVLFDSAVMYVFNESVHLGQQQQKYSRHIKLLTSKVSGGKGGGTPFSINRMWYCSFIVSLKQE
jgi:hypothetical protein